MTTVSPTISRDTVFVAGGQPTITYVERSEDVERKLARAVKMPNEMVSLSGPTKTGKTVLCRHVLRDAEYVWIEGGQVKEAKAIWDKICYELNFPTEIAKTEGKDHKAEIKAGLVDFIFSTSGSRLHTSKQQLTYKIDSMVTALRRLQADKISIVIDDFHYLPKEAQLEFLRNVKGPVFAGLKLVLLATPHRKFDAIKAEDELTARCTTVEIEPWKSSELVKIPEIGFRALNVQCPASIMDSIVLEAQGSPFLMQKLCWEICYEMNIDTPAKHPVAIPNSFNLRAIYTKIAGDFGFPIYQRLEAGPQSRKNRQRRPLKWGGDADVYEAILIAMAETGPTPEISYDELRHTLSTVLTSNRPQKHEITAALKHLASISMQAGKDSGIDWDEGSRKIDIGDPYLRFYLRWKVRHEERPETLLLSHSPGDSL